jgi:proline racemase
MDTIRVVDSHTGGEPIRLVLEGVPDLGTGTLTERAHRFRDASDRYRSAIVSEPRGTERTIGALLAPPSRPGCEFGVIFFNHLGLVGFCGHGIMGVVKSLAHLGRLSPGKVQIDTPIAPVEAELHDDGSVSVEYVPSHRTVHAFAVRVHHHGSVIGDIAWGGRWHYLVRDYFVDIELSRLDELLSFCDRIREAVNHEGYPAIKFIELFAPPKQPGAHSRNFVFGPGRNYARCPSCNGTSAKIACLAVEGKLAEGETWLQEGFYDGVFAARYRWISRETGLIIPTLTGTAHVMAESTLQLDERDFLCWGLRP